MMAIHNSTYQKHANTALILGNIWRAGHTSRVRIARELELYRSTVTNILNALVEEGIVCEGEPIGARESGRKPISLAINGAFGHVVGIDLQPSHYIAIAVDMTGTLLFEQQGSNAHADIAEAVAAIMLAVEESITSLGTPTLAICVAIPGVVDTDRNIIKGASLFHTRNYDLRQRFPTFPIPMLMENDANCCAWWHLSQRDGKEEENFICVFGDYHDDGKADTERLGAGVGLGISIGGTVYGGSFFAAGEMHTLSWRRNHAGQSGLGKTLLGDFSTDIVSYRLFVRDFFASLVPIVTALDPAVCHIHGKTFKGASPLSDVLAYEVPQFLAVLEQRGCRLDIDTGDHAIVAKGAAMMFLHKLYSDPGLPVSGKGTRIIWEDVFAARRDYLRQADTRHSVRSTV